MIENVLRLATVSVMLTGSKAPISLNRSEIVVPERLMDYLMPSWWGTEAEISRTPSNQFVRLRDLRMLR